MSFLDYPDSITSSIAWPSFILFTGTNLTYTYVEAPVSVLTMQKNAIIGE
jgi:hypothetical protein